MPIWIVGALIAAMFFAGGYVVGWRDGYQDHRHPWRSSRHHQEETDGPAAQGEPPAPTCTGETRG